LPEGKDRPKSRAKNEAVKKGAAKKKTAKKSSKKSNAELARSNPNRSKPHAHQDVRHAKKNRPQKPHLQKRGSNESVRVVFLGGLGEIGRNCAAIEVNTQIILIDCGIMFPEPDMPGIDLVLPDFSYLRDNKDKVAAVLLTHGHEDHTGGLAFLLRELEVPIYGSAMSLGLARNRIEEAGQAHRTSFIEVHDGERRSVGPCDVEFIPVTHSVPHAFALAIHTPAGVILHSGDFKIDLDPVDGRRTDLARMGELAKGPGISLLLADSTNAEEPGFTASERSVGIALTRIFPSFAGRRVVVACFASHIHRVQQVIDAAVASGRKVATLGRSMGKNVELAVRLGILEIPHGVMVDIEEISSLPDGEICVLSTGSQGEPMSALTLMATGQNRRFSLGEGDVVVISAHPIPGNEWSVGRVIDELHRHGATVVHTGKEPVHVSGHARRGELATLLNVTQPKTFIPVHGEYRHLVHHAELARSMGVDPEQVLLCLDGDAVVLSNDKLRRDGTVPSGYLYVDGTVGDVGHGVLRDRRILSEEGVVVAVVTIDLQHGVVTGDPQIVTKGWVYAAEAEELLAEAGRVITQSLSSSLAEGVHDVELLSSQVRRVLGKFVNERTKRRPMIVPLLIAV
jgi:ribonuclease J